MHTVRIIKSLRNQLNVTMQLSLGYQVGSGHETSDRKLYLQWNLRERDALGKWPMSLVERSSLSWRFVSFHPNTCLFPIYNELFTVGVSNDNSQL